MSLSITHMKKVIFVIALFSLLVFTPTLAFAEDASSSPKPRGEGIVSQIRDLRQQGKQTSCDARVQAVQKRSQQLTQRAQNIEDVFNKIAVKVEDYYTTKGLTVSNYQALVDTIAAKKAAVDTSVASANDVANNFSCTDLTKTKSEVQAFRVAMQNVIKALKDYKTSVKNLIVAVRTAK